MDNKVVGVIIAATISLIVVAGILVPIVNDAVATSDTFTNDGYYTMDYNEDFTITWSSADKYFLDVDGDKLDIRDCFGELARSIVVTNNMVIRCIFDNDYVNILSHSTEGRFWAVNSNGTGDLTITNVDGVVTATFRSNSTDEYTVKTYVEASDVYGINGTGTGAFTMKDMNEPAIVGADSIVTLGGTTTIGTDIGVFATGVYDNLTFSFFDGEEVSPAISNVEIHKTPLNGYIDAYKLEKYTFDVTIDGAATLVTYSYFLVPTEVTADRAAPMDSAPAGIIEAIPIIVIVAILALIAGIMIRSRF